MTSNNLEVARYVRYVNAKQNGKDLVDGNEFTYKKSPTHAEKVYYVCTHKTRIGCDATAVVQGDKIVKKYGRHNHDTNLVQKGVREERRTRPSMRHLPTTPGMTSRIWLPSLKA